MYMVSIDGNGGSFYDTREEAVRDLELFGFRPSCYVGSDYEKLLFTGRECKIMTATIKEEL